MRPYQYGGDALVIAMATAAPYPAARREYSAAGRSAVIERGEMVANGMARLARTRYSEQAMEPALARRLAKRRRAVLVMQEI